MTIRNSTRNRLLAGVGTTVLATALASAALAAESTIAPDPAGVVVNAHLSELAQLTNSANITAEVDGDLDDISVGIDLIEIGDGDPISANVSTNLVSATATGNNFSNIIDFAQAEDPSLLIQDGAAALGFAVNADEAVASSRIVDAEIGVILDGFTGGSAVNVDNTITARTLVNTGSNAITGEIPSAYVSGTEGSSTYDFAGGTLDAEGSIVASSVQQNLGGGHSATVEGNLVGLIITTDLEDNEVESSPRLDNNTVSASLTANTASNLIGLEAGEAPSFQGSAVITNLQANLGGTNQESNATNTGSRIAATISGAGADAINTLNGGLSVQDNTISSGITGNDASGTALSAGNRIVLGDGISFVGAGGDPAGSDIAYTGGGVGGTVTADLVIQNSQGNNGASAGDRQELSATTLNGVILANVESLENGSVTQEGNAVRASVTGNTASSAIASGQNAATFNGTVAVASQQTNDNTDLTASNTDAIIATQVGTVFGVPDNEGGLTHGSSVSVAGNAVAASGYGNSVEQTIALAANDLTTGTGNVALTGGTDGQGSVEATGAATIANLQSGYASSLQVSNTGSLVGIDADSRDGLTFPGNSIVGAALTVDNNRQEAVALANSAGNALSLDGNTVGSSAGIANVQILDGNSSVEASLENAAAGVYAGTHVLDSAIDVTRNVQRAVAYGSSAGNQLTVEATTATVTPAADAASIVFFDGSSSRSFDSGTAEPAVSAAYGVLNNQTTEADISASAIAAGPLDGAIGAVIEGNLTNSSVANETNSFVAAAYGNDASNGIDLDAGTIDVGGHAAVANVTNTQSVASSISATATGDDLVLTVIEDNVEASSVSTSGNTIRALATGNRAGENGSVGNSLTVSGTTIDTASASFTPGLSVEFAGGGVTELTANAAFTIQNAQSAQGSISASLVDDVDDPTSSASVRTVIGATRTDPGASDGSILGSSVVSDGNLIAAAATGNVASNRLAIDGNSVATTSGATNFQTSSADLSATVGVAGLLAGVGPDTPFTFEATGTGLAGNTVGSTVTLTAGTLTVDENELNAAQIAFLVSQGWTHAGGVVTGSATILGTITLAAYTALNEGQPADLSGLLPGVWQPGTPNQGGVTVVAGTEVSSAIIGSTISVSGNETSASVTGNTAVTRVEVSATEIAAAGDLTSSSTGNSPIALSAEADHSLVNRQYIDGDDSDLVSTVFGSFGIDTFEGADISGSTLTVSNNTQRADANANVGTNLLSLDGTAISTGSALVSEQLSETATLDASSNLDLFAPAAVTGSTVDLSSNDNLAVATINSVTNVIDVKASSISTLDPTDAPAGTIGNASLTALAAGAITGSADHVLNNRQVAGESVAASATTTLSNWDIAAETTTGLVGSTVTVTGNRTIGQAYANDAVNALNLTATASQGASGGIVNRQTSTATARADADNITRIGLNDGTGTAAMSGSSVTMDANVTAANARGNSAVNALTSTAGAGYGASSETAAGTASNAAGTNTQANANAAVLNVQSNGGAVSARTTSTYAVALNAGASVGTSVITNGTVSVSGNVASASAYGNKAENSVTLSVLAGGAPTSAIGSSQVNTGAILASVTGTQIGMTGTGAASTSSLGVSGNTISANAVGNSVSNAIRRN